MSGYFVVLTNLCSIPCILYYQYQKKYFYSLQVLLNSLFSFLHHLNGSGLKQLSDNGIFDFLDGLYSYLSIYIFSIYLFLSNHEELKTELYLIKTILLSLVYLSFGTNIILPSLIFMIFFITGMQYQKMNKLILRNFNFIMVILLSIADVACFFAAIEYEYNYLHGIHHLIAFNIPIFIDKYILENQNQN